MANNILIILVIFIIINIIQTWLIIFYKSLIRGAVFIGIIEAVEIPMIIYLITKGAMVGFLTVVFVEISQCLIIAYFSTSDKILNSNRKK